MSARFAMTAWRPMTARVARTLGAAASLCVAVAVLSACAPSPEPARTPQPWPTAAPAAESAVEPTPAPSAEPTADPTCETIVSQGTVDALTGLGWAAEESAFTVGETVLEGGIRCGWADWEHPSDHGQFFAWAPVDAEDGKDLQSRLLAEGWIREAADDGLYITEDPATAFQTDEDGYGMTYLFGDGWVKMADTKQSLILIEAP